MMRTRIGLLLITLFFVSNLMAAEPKELAELRQQFQAIPHPTEADRVSYITKLVRLRESFTRADAKEMEAIDAEIIKHPMPQKVSESALRELLVGQWTSPRHSYLYRDKGTWTMLPEFDDGVQSTHGTWRIEGNQFFQDALIEPPDPPDKGETIIILTGTDFVWGTHIAPYYMRRGDIFPWRD